MEKKEPRRKHKRYPVRWKAAVVFDKAAGKPILHTQTQDMSVGGTAIHSEYGDLTGAVVTLLLAHPPRGNEAPKMLKIKSQIVSTMQTPSTAGYRHGISFVISGDEGLRLLAEVLRTTESGQQNNEAATAPAAPESGTTTGRLAALRSLAQAKLAEPPQVNLQEEMNQRVSDALQRAFNYLKDLCEQLNVVKPAYTNKGYAIVGVPEFTGLTWENGRVDFRTKDISATKKLWEQVTLYIRISANKQINVTRDYPASERLKQLLTDNKIEFTVDETRNAKGSIERTVFKVPCQFVASVLLEGKFDTGNLLLKMRNVERFGMMEYLVSPEAVTEAALEEFAGFILAESSRVGSMLGRT